jgi:hypothetical protein
MACAIDPVEFALACGITPDPWQADLLRSTARRALLLCSRQSGKSTVTALLALWTALFEAGTVVIASPSQRQSTEMLRTIRGFLAALGEDPPGDSITKLELANGARILAVPGDERTIRGVGGVALVVIDEASRVEDGLLAGVTPMLATTGGRLVALTTPAGRRGWFYEQWHADSDWLRIRVAASDCPRISKEFLAEERKLLGTTQFSQEYELQFIADGDSAFDDALIGAALSRDFEPFFIGGAL